MFSAASKCRTKVRSRHIQSKLKEAFTPPLRSSPYTRSVGAQNTGKNYALLQSCNDLSKRVQLNIESMAVNNYCIIMISEEH